MVIHLRLCRVAVVRTLETFLTLFLYWLKQVSINFLLLTFMSVQGNHSLALCYFLTFTQFPLTLIHFLSFSHVSLHCFFNDQVHRGFLVWFLLVSFFDLFFDFLCRKQTETFVAFFRDCYSWFLWVIELGNDPFFHFVFPVAVFEDFI